MDTASIRESVLIPTSPRAHGLIPVRGERQVPMSSLHDGRYGRMFRKLPPAPALPREQLEALAAMMVDDDPVLGGWNGVPTPRDNPDIPAGYTYLGQFIDHDITFDPASSLQRQNDLNALTNFRSPRLDLDSLYGSGPADEPFQYERGSRGLRFLIEANRDGEIDLPRNSQDVALLGDPRNDENIIVGQLQLLFLRLHNRLGEEVLADPNVPEDAKFEETQRRVRWRYQWVLLFDYLRRTVGQDTFDHLVRRLPDGTWDLVHPHFRPKNNAYMPVEFSAAGFRFGHSQIRGIYDLNAVVTERPIFIAGDVVDPLADLRGFRRLPSAWTIDWTRFFPIAGSAPQLSRLIDARLAPGLFDLPGFESDSSLALRNLIRGQVLGLPSGQDVARHLGVQVLSGGEIAAPEPTPLWFYILAEAGLLGDGGRHLGPVGGRIVGEVLLGLLEMDPTGWLSIDQGWRPTVDGSPFEMPELVQLALGQA